MTVNTRKICYKKKSSATTEMWFYHRMLRISWPEHTINEEVLGNEHRQGKLMYTIKYKQLAFFRAAKEERVEEFNTHRA